MRWLLWYARTLWCHHTWTYDEADWTRRQVYESGLTLNASGIMVSATCTKCGWHRTYVKEGETGMSRAQCDHCGHVWSTTASPNDTEGHWLSAKAIEDLDCAVDTNEGELSVMEWIDEHGPSVDRCPHCHQFSLVCEAGHSTD